MHALVFHGPGQLAWGDVGSPAVIARSDSEVTTAGGGSTAGTHVEELKDDECRRLLGRSTVGRIALVVDGRPVVLPVNYRFLTGEFGLWILLRTRPGRAIDHAPEQVAFEVDGIDVGRQEAWSVLVRGVLQHLDHNEIELFSHPLDLKPWPEEGRSSWLAIKSRTVTGRRLHAAEPEWALPSEAFL